jgi:TolB-like protein
MIVFAFATLIAAYAPTDPCVIDVTATSRLEVNSSCATGKLSEGDRLLLSAGGFVVVEREGVQLTCVKQSGAPQWAVMTAEGPRVEQGRPWTCRATGPARTGIVEVPRLDARVTPATGSDTPASVSAAMPQATAPLPLLVVALDAIAAPPTVGDILNDVILSHLDRDRRIKVSDTGELSELLRRAAELAAVDGSSASAASCSERSEACVQAVASSLGGRYVLSGSVSASDRLLQVQLILLDSDAGTVMARTDYRAINVVQAADVLPDALHNVMRPLLGGELLTLPAPPALRTVDAAETVQGAGVAGAVSAAGLGVGWLLPLCGGAVCAAQSPGALAGLGAGALACSVLGPCYAPPLAFAGALVGAMLGDSAFGYDIDVAKALVLAAAAGGTALSLALVSVGLLVAAAVGTIPLIDFVSGGQLSPENSALAGSVAGVASVGVLLSGLVLALLGGAGVGLGFTLLTPVLEPAPDPLGVVNEDHWLSADLAAQLSTRVAERTQRF